MILRRDTANCIPIFTGCKGTSSKLRAISGNFVKWNQDSSVKKLRSRTSSLFKFC
ncbi:unnamed protein product [Tenebrio molitor]|nr:unnamed protein product [Tenebrio molitor]